MSEKGWTLKVGARCRIAADWTSAYQMIGTVENVTADGDYLVRDETGTLDAYAADDLIDPDAPYLEDEDEYDDLDNFEGDV